MPGTGREVDGPPMSAIGIGNDTALRAPRAGRKAGEKGAAKTPRRTTRKSAESSAPVAFAKWIPGEALVFYAAILGLGAGQPQLTGEESSKQLLERIDASASSWFFAALGITVALVVVGAVSSPKDGEPLAVGALVVRCVLAGLSFTIWSTALPGAWPWGWHAVRDMGEAYALLLVPLAVIFTGVAQVLTDRAEV